MIYVIGILVVIILIMGIILAVVSNRKELYRKERDHYYSELQAYKTELKDQQKWDFKTHKKHEEINQKITDIISDNRRDAREKGNAAIDLFNGTVDELPDNDEDS